MRHVLTFYAPKFAKILLGDAVGTSILMAPRTDRVLQCSNFSKEIRDSPERAALS